MLEIHERNRFKVIFGFEFNENLGVVDTVFQGSKILGKLIFLASGYRWAIEEARKQDENLDKKVDDLLLAKDVAKLMHNSDEQIIVVTGNGNHENVVPRIKELLKLILGHEEIFI